MEHGIVTRAIILSDDEVVVDKIDECVTNQVASLPEPNQETASEALKQMFAVKCELIDEYIKISDSDGTAPEYLEIQTSDAMAFE